MACYSAEHAYNEADSSKIASCQINDVIWMIRWPYKRPTEMRKFDLNTRQWQKVTIRNGDLVKAYNGDVVNALNAYYSTPVEHKTYAWNGNILLARNKQLGEWTYVTELFVFDTIKLEWSHLINLPSYFTQSCLCIKDNVMYTIINPNAGRRHCAKICLRTFQITPLQGLEVTPWDHFRFIEMNGMVYAMKMQSEGGKITVYQYDTYRDTFIEIHEECRSHIGRVEFEEQRCIWTRTYNNKIYQAYKCCDKFLIIDLFDIETKKWATVFKSRYCHRINGVYSLNNTFYVVSGTWREVIIREIDLLPSLETLSLRSICASFVDAKLKRKAEEKEEEKRRIYSWLPNYRPRSPPPIQESDWTALWPFCLKARFNNIVDFMLQDKGELRRDRRTNC